MAGPATDIVPVTPDDVSNLADVAIALYVESGGVLSVLTERGAQRVVSVASNSILPLGVRRVNATGTTATGIHAMVVS